MLKLSFYQWPALFCQGVLLCLGRWCDHNRADAVWLCCRQEGCQKVSGCGVRRRRRQQDKNIPGRDVRPGRLAFKTALAPAASKQAVLVHPEYRRADSYR